MPAIPTMAWLALILAGSLLSNVYLYNRLQGQKEETAQAQHALQLSRAETENAVEAAQTCSASVQRLSDLADQRAKEATTARQQAVARARQHNRRADAALAAPPAVPGNDCASADARVRQWLRSRK